MINNRAINCGVRNILSLLFGLSVNDRQTGAHIIDAERALNN